MNRSICCREISVHIMIGIFVVASMLQVGMLVSIVCGEWNNPTGACRQITINDSYTEISTAVIICLAYGNIVYVMGIIIAFMIITIRRLPYDECCR